MRENRKEKRFARNAVPRKNCVAIALMVVIAQLGCGRQEEKKLMTRTELDRLIMGKTEDQVLQAIGRPQSTSSRPDIDDEFWYFSGIDYDPVSLKIDTFTQVVFKNYAEGARVIQVNH